MGKIIIEGNKKDNKNPLCINGSYRLKQGVFGAAYGQERGGTRSVQGQYKGSKRATGGRLRGSYKRI